jgi:hypothetical protein
MKEKPRTNVDVYNDWKEYIEKRNKINPVKKEYSQGK